MGWRRWVGHLLRWMVLAAVLSVGGSGAWAGVSDLPAALPDQPLPVDRSVRLTHADAWITAAGQVQQQTVSLPFHWDPGHPGQPGEAVFEIPFLMAPGHAQLWALLLPKLGNAYEVWLNGVLLDRKGDLVRGNGADYTQRPRLIPLAPGLLQANNLLRVHIRADVGRRGGLATPVLGPEVEVQALYEWQYFLTASAVLAVSLFSLLIGLVSLSLWLTQPGDGVAGQARRQPLYLYAGVAELAWSIGVGYTLLDEPPLAWPWWGMVLSLAMATWITSMVQFCAEAAGWGHTLVMVRFRWVLGLVLFSSFPLSGWALGLGQPGALTVWYVGAGLAAGVFALVFMWQAWRAKGWEHRLLAAALALNVVIGFRDIVVFRLQPEYGQITWLRYSSVLFGATLLFIVVMRFRSTSAQARELLQTLASRVADRERELRDSYARLEQLAREQERASERTRILRDMHDGVGAHLSAAIRQVESGQADDAELLATLRDSLDQLKLSIDAMNLPAGDVAGLLAGLRYRLGPRFAIAGLQLEWRVEALEPLARLDSRAMRHLQFIVFEAFSNVLQHAQATHLTVEACPVGTGVRLNLRDNGRGFDTGRAPTNGLRQMQERAALIGAALHLSSSAAGTELRLELPA